MIYAKYTEPNAGWDCDKKQVKEHLELNELYAVDYINMGQSSTSIYLIDFPKNMSFNSVHFEFYENGKSFRYIQ